VRVAGELPGALSSYPETPPPAWARANGRFKGSPNLLPGASVTAGMCRPQVSFVTKWLQMWAF